MKKLMLLETVLRRRGGGSTAPPDAPTGLSATVISTSRIDLAWTDAATTETEYRVYRSTDGVSYSLLTTLAANSNSHSDTTISAGTTYYYKVGSYNAGGESLSSAVSANTLTLSLISYWKLEEASGTRDDAVGTNDLSPTNAPGNAAGKLGNAAAFVGASSQQLSVADNATLRSGNIDHTISAWVYPGSVTGLQCIACKANSDTGNPDGYEFMLYLNGANVNLLVGKGTGGTGNNTDLISSDVTVTTNTWYYVEGYFSTAGTLAVVVNTTVKTKTALTIPGTTTGSFRIGGMASTYYLTGRVDEVSFWKRLLTTEERAYLYNSGAGRTLFL